MTKLKKWDVKGKYSFPIDTTGRLNFSMMNIAPRRSGKTSFTRYLVKKYFYNKYDLFIVYTTEPNFKDYDAMLPDNSKIYTNLEDLDKIDIIFEKNAESEKPANVLLIFDDTISLKQTYDSRILDIYAKGRHYNVSIIYNTQSPTMVSNIWKENSDFIFIWDPKTAKRKRYAAENLMAGVDGKIFNKPVEERNHYLKIINEITRKKYHIIVINLVDMKLFWFKPPFVKIINS